MENCPTGRRRLFWDGDRLCARGRDVRAGDDLVFLGQKYRLLTFTPYDPTRIGLPAEDGWRIAEGAKIGDRPPFGITLEPRGRYQIVPQLDDVVPPAPQDEDGAVA